MRGGRREEERGITRLAIERAPDRSAERISKFRARRDEVRFARHSRDRQRECNARAIDRKGERRGERRRERQREREREREGEDEKAEGAEHLVPANVTELHRSLSKTRVNIFARRFFR